MNGVKLLDRQSKPSAVESMNPVVSEDEKEKPHEQQSVVDYRAPQKSIT
jgi:hypothetical protein